MQKSESNWHELARDWLNGRQPQVAVILGSGLGSIADSIEDSVVLDYSQVPGLPKSKVPGHAGKFICGTLERTHLLVACGRVHAYEGYQPDALGAHVRFLAACGIKSLVATNAAGALVPTMQPGSWMLVTDHINLLGLSPLQGYPHFLDMTNAYDLNLRKAFLTSAHNLGIPLHSGIYAAVKGPQYETPAEVCMLASFGAQAVGMSTVPEVIQARMLGLRVAALSCITNLAAGISDTPASHDEVLSIGHSSVSVLRLLISEFLKQLP